jgi:thioredoxin-like negative regulator of GroEL
VISALALSLLLGAPAANAPIHWERDFDSALKRARKAGKPLVVDFWADWCGWCERLDQTTYRDAKIVKLLADFVPVKVNTEGSRREVEVAVKYGVSSLPTVVFLSPSGRAVLTLQGFQGPGQFPEVVQQAKAEADKLIKLEAALERNPNDAGSLLGLAIHLVENDGYPEARALLARARENDATSAVPDRKQVRMLLGTLEYYDGHYGEAAAILREGLSLRPEGELEPKILYVLAKTYLKWGRTQQARATLQAVLDGYASSPIAQKARETLVALDGQR